MFDRQGCRTKSLSTRAGARRELSFQCGRRARQVPVMITGAGKTNGRTSVRPLGDIKIAML